MLKNAANYEFSTLPLETAPFQKDGHVLLGTERVLTQEQNAETKCYDILQDNNEYDITFVVTLNSDSDSSADGVVNMDYVVLMTSRRELFPNLTLDRRLTKKSPSSSALSSMHGARKDSEEMEQDKGEEKNVQRTLVLGEELAIKENFASQDWFGLQLIGTLRQTKIQGASNNVAFEVHNIRYRL